MGNEYPTVTYTALRDSMGSDGSSFHFFLGFGPAKIESDGDVVLDPFGVYPITQYRLSAAIGDRWKLRATSSTEYASVVDIYPMTIFGRKTMVKEFAFYLYDPWHDEEGDSVWYCTRRLALGIGLIDEFYEPGVRFYLSGARIGGIAYGGLLPSSVPSVHLPMSLAVWPNPCTDNLTIALPTMGNEPVSLVVTDALGRTVSVPYSPLHSGPEPQITLTTAGLLDGIYYFQIRTNKRTCTGSFVRRGVR